MREDRMKPKLIRKELMLSNSEDEDLIHIDKKTE